MRHLCVLLVLAVAGCGAEEPTTVSGPLCERDAATLRDDAPNAAVTWTPVVTTFEAVVRASGIEQ